MTGPAPRRPGDAGTCGDQVRQVEPRAAPAGPIQVKARLMLCPQVLGSPWTSALFTASRQAAEEGCPNGQAGACPGFSKGFSTVEPSLHCWTPGRACWEEGPVSRPPACPQLLGPGAHLAKLAPWLVPTHSAEKCGVLFCEGGRKPLERTSCTLTIRMGVCQALSLDDGTAFEPVPEGTKCGHEQVGAATAGAGPRLEPACALCGLPLTQLLPLGRDRDGG